MIASLTEEAETIGWYEQRMSLERNSKAIMANAQKGSRGPLLLRQHRNEGTAVHLPSFRGFFLPEQGALCEGDWCLHEVYLQSRAGHRVVFSAHARDLKMVNDYGTTGLEVSGEPPRGRFRWNGGRFVRVTTGKE
jgi:hypothetical protein